MCSNCDAPPAWPPRPLGPQAWCKHRHEHPRWRVALEPSHGVVDLRCDIGGYVQSGRAIRCEQVEDLRQRGGGRGAAMRRAWAMCWLMLEAMRVGEDAEDSAHRTHRSHPSHLCLNEASTCLPSRVFNDESNLQSRKGVSSRRLPRRGPGAGRRSRRSRGRACPSPS